MFIDIHVHPAFYEPINADENREELRHQELDIHKNGTAPLEHIFNQMRCAGLDKLCLLPEDYTSTVGCALVSNEEIRTLVNLAPDRFIGFASADPFDPEAPDRLEEAFTRLKLKGLKLHPGRQHFMPGEERLEAIYQVCERYDKPILFHAGLSWEPDTFTRYCQPTAFEEVAEKHPRLRICLGHFAWPWVREAAMLMVKYPNVYADTGALYFDNAYEFYTQTFTKDIPVTWIDRSLRHQVMFGSNNPRFEQIRMADAITKIGLRDSTLELVKGLNAVEFLKMQYVKTIHILTKVYNEFDVITPQVEAIVAESGVKNGMVTVLTKHTTTGVTVNEALECLESDIAVALSLFAPEDRPYSHARMLRDYGSTAGNPTGHLKALVTGSHCHFLIQDGKINRGGAQDVYFCEYDGPASRNILVIVEGE